MNKPLLKNMDNDLSPFLLCLVLLVLVGCGKTSEPTLAQRSDELDQRSDELAPPSAAPQPAATDGTVSQLDPVTEKQPIQRDSATKTAPVKQQPPAKSTVDIAKFMEDALEGRTEAVEQAIDAGVDVNARDEERRTALMLAGFNGHTETVKTLLKHGAKIDERDSMGRTPLMFAATGDNAAACEALLDAGSDVNATDTGEGFTPLMHAAAEGQLAVVKLLLQHHADRNRRDIDGDTAKSFAQQNGHAEVVEALTK